MAYRAWTKVAAVLLTASSVGIAATGCGGAGNNNTAGGGGGGAQTATAPVEGGNILLDSTGNVDHLDPALSYDTSSNEAVSEMYDQLVTYKGNTVVTKPMLAQSWKITDGGKTYTFHLRKDATFWNGDKVTSKSFVDEFERVLTPTLASPGEGFLDPIVVGSTAFNKGTAKQISGLSAPDPYTLVIHLTKPEPFFLQVLAMPFFSAVDQAYINKVGNKAFDTTTAMGSGPFKLQSFNIDQMILAKNPKYWMKDTKGNRLPYLDKVTINVNKNGNIDALNFEQGKTALMGNLIGIPSSAFPHFSTDPTLKKLLIHMAANEIRYLGLNTSVAPFTNPKVRQAVEYAIDKKRIIQSLNNRGIPADQPLPPAIAGHVNNLPAGAAYTYNPQKAKALLKAAGYPNGFSTTLYTYNTPDIVKIANIMQNNLQQVGINAKINSTDWNTFLDINEKGNVQPMFTLAWVQDFPDASDFLNTLFNSNQRPQNNSTMYNNPQVDAWLNKAQTDPNQAERTKIYEQASIQIMKDAPWVPLYYPVTYYASQSWVHGFYMSPVLPDPLQYIWIDQSHSQG